MPVGPAHLPTLPALDGVRWGTAATGMRYQNRDDLALLELPADTIAAACFTQNHYRAAPILIAQHHLQTTPPRYLLINAGTANACTGEPGLQAATDSCAALAKLTALSPAAILPFSTGVIGEPLDTAALTAALPAAIESLSTAPAAWERAARAIMTTDTRPKLATATCSLAGHRAQINGIAKGAGMLCPNMATMLAFVVTDARLSAAALDALCRQATEKSFNRISVDGDTSTNDAVLLAATGRANTPSIDALDSPAGRALATATTALFQDLAQQLVRDAEGATRLVTLDVTGGATSADCLQVARTLSTSPLVKTALYAGDPNWGRLVAAIGRAGIAGLDPARVKLAVGDTPIFANGQPAPHYNETQGRALFAPAELRIQIDLGMGKHREQFWTCDLSPDYVRINADYRS